MAMETEQESVQPLLEDSEPRQLHPSRPKASSYLSALPGRTSLMLRRKGHAVEGQRERKAGLAPGAGTVQMKGSDSPPRKTPRSDRPPCRLSASGGLATRIKRVCPAENHA